MNLAQFYQAELLFLPPDNVKHRTYKYALTVVDVASRLKDAEPLTDKTATQVMDAFSQIHKRGPLLWPELLQVNPEKEFMCGVTQLMKQKVPIRRGEAGNHQAQGIVKRKIRTLAEQLFPHQYAQEMLIDGVRSTEWVRQLRPVLDSMNTSETRLLGKKPADAIKLRRVSQKPSLPTLRLVGLDEQKLPSGVGVRYLYQPGELGGGRRRSTDPVWSLEV